MKEDKKKLLELIRNLNSKNLYAPLAQHLLSHLLPRFRPDPFLEAFPQNQQELKGLMQVS